MRCSGSAVPPGATATGAKDTAGGWAGRAGTGSSANGTPGCCLLGGVVQRCGQHPGGAAPTVHGRLDLQLAIFSETSCNNRQGIRTVVEAAAVPAPCRMTRRRRGLQAGSVRRAAKGGTRRCCGQAEPGPSLLAGAPPHGHGREAGQPRHLPHWSGRTGRRPPHDGVQCTSSPRLAPASLAPSTAPTPSPAATSCPDPRPALPHQQREASARRRARR